MLVKGISKHVLAIVEVYKFEANVKYDFVTKIMFGMHANLSQFRTILYI